MIKTISSVAALTAALLSVTAGEAHAFSPAPMPEWGEFSYGVTGGKFYYNGGKLTITDMMASSGYENFIYLASPGYQPTKLSFLFTDNSIATAIFTPAEMRALGIRRGYELVFAIIPNSGLASNIPNPPLPVFPSTSPFTSDPVSYVMFSGDATRNGDGLFHAAVFTGSGPDSGNYVMGFEDIYHGGDQDFNDAAFKVTSGAQETPGDTIPGPLPLLGVGAAFGFSRKLRNRIKQVS